MSKYLPSPEVTRYDPCIRVSRSGFSIEDFAARSGASTSSIERYTYQLRPMETWMETPLADASQRDLIELKKRLRGMASGKQYAALLRMFHKSAANAAADRDAKDRYRDLRDLLVLKQRVKRLSPQAATPSAGP